MYHFLSAQKFLLFFVCLQTPVVYKMHGFLPSGPTPFLCSWLALFLLEQPEVPPWALGWLGGRCAYTSHSAGFQAGARELERDALGPCAVCPEPRAGTGQQGRSQLLVPRQAPSLILHLWCERAQISHPGQKLFFKNILQNAFCSLPI